MINNKLFKKIVIVGLGGTGSMLAMPLCRYLNSISDEYKFDVVFIDGESYEIGNITRQNFSIASLNTNKASAQFELVSQNIPGIRKNAKAIEDYLSSDNVDSIITNGTIVFNCSDNKAARKTVEDRCLQLSNAIHICCGNERVRGQVQTSIICKGRQITPSIYEKFPELNSNDGDRAEMSCEQLSKLPSGGQVICANMMAASLALNVFCSLIESPMRDDQITSCSIFNCYLNSVETDQVVLNV